MGLIATSHKGNRSPQDAPQRPGKGAARAKVRGAGMFARAPDSILTLTAADFRAGIMREFRINENYAKTVAKWMAEGDGKPVRVKILGKVHWHGTADQLAALQNPPLKGVK